MGTDAGPIALRNAEELEGVRTGDVRQGNPMDRRDLVRIGARLDGGPAHTTIGVMR